MPSTQSVAAALLATALLAACAAPADAPADTRAAGGDVAETPTPDARGPSPAASEPSSDDEPTEAAPLPPDDEPSDDTDAEPGAPTVPRLTDAELSALGVNELGRVLVGEWHIIGDADGEYRTSRATLRRQLEELYARGYRPVTEAEFLAGTFPIPAGTSPLLLTFDDSTRGHVDLGPDGEPLPDTAVGIIEEFAAVHDDWRPTAVFAYNFPEPFGDAGFADELRWLLDNGYELSNHSVGHTNLGSLPSSAVVANLAENLALLQDAVPGATVSSLTLPFGAHAEDPAVELTGTAEGTTYTHELVYLVGSDPTRSPHHEAFDPAAIQRVPAHAVVGSDESWFWDWLDRLDDESLRFVSDGDPGTVTYPSSLADVAAVDISRHTVREY